MIKLAELHKEIDVFKVDLDGTLVDSHLSIELAVEAFVNKYKDGHEPSEEAIAEALTGVPASSYIELFEQLYKVDIPNKASALQYYIDQVRSNQHNNRIYEGVDEIIRKTREAGIPIAIITSATKQEGLGNIALLEQLVGEKFYDAVNFSIPGNKAKPNVDPMTNIKQQLDSKGILSNRWSYIGDNPNDIRFVINCNASGQGQGIPLFVEHQKELSSFPNELQEAVGRNNYKHIQELL